MSATPAHRRVAARKKPASIQPASMQPEPVQPDPVQPDPAAVDPAASAQAAGLRHVSDTQPGLHRKRSGKSFRYTGIDGRPVRDAETLRRIRSLVIPPAWTDVWICANPRGHLQATGRDVRGRKQSRYHPQWRQVRDETKYQRMTLFAAALPALREQVGRDLARPGLPREKVLATIVSLMEATLIRVGNEEYARANHSYGLTTLRNRHVDLHGADIQFTFRGKSGVQHAISLHDRRLANIIRRCEEIPGHELFQYLDAEGNHHAIDSSAVNEYLHEVTGQHFTAKDFRTWAGSVLASVTLRDFEPFTSAAEAKKNIVAAIASVAERLGNTPSVCRKCYVHPAVLESYLGGITPKAARKRLDKDISRHAKTLREEEQALLNLLAQRATLEGK